MDHFHRVTKPRGTFCKFTVPERPRCLPSSEARGSAQSSPPQQLHRPFPLKHPNQKHVTSKVQRNATTTFPDPNRRPNRGKLSQRLLPSHWAAPTAAACYGNAGTLNPHSFSFLKKKKKLCIWLPWVSVAALEGSSSLTRNWTWGLCFKITQSCPLEQQGTPKSMLFKF